MNNSYKHFEQQYKQLIAETLEGEVRNTRNGSTISRFYSTLEFDLSSGRLPLITSRQMFTKGVLGEYAAIIRGPKYINDFKIWGCNYWDKWADKDTGRINVDYGTKWRDFNGANQIDTLLYGLVNDPTGRRHLLLGWDPSNLDNLDLPCCHYAYQFYVRKGNILDMIWHQRSADVMIGIPSDALFAATMLLSFAGATGLKAGKCTMVFGDTHIYEEHIDNVYEYLSAESYAPPSFRFTPRIHPTLFIPSDLKILDYKHGPNIKFELKD
jgi:thymidylate synthase